MLTCKHTNFRFGEYIDLL